VIFLAGAVVAVVLLASIYSIGPTQIGLVRKRFGAKLRETILWRSAEKLGTRRNS